MSEPLLWIVVPLIGGLILFFLQRHRRMVVLSGVLLLSGLALLAWKLPSGDALTLGPITIQLNDTLDILGRKMVLTFEDRPSLILIYLVVAYWFIGSGVARTTRLFVPLGLGMVAFLVSALIVEPFLYSALFIEMAVLLSLPILSPPGKPVGRGVLRFLIFQTLALPFILFTGWMLSGVESGIADPDLIRRAGLLLGLGFAFLLAIFPFSSWIPVIAEEEHPYPVGFILVMFPMTGLLFAMKFLDQYSWLRTWRELYQIIQIVGTITVMAGGVGALFQENLARAMGYAAIGGVGFSLLAMGVGNASGNQIFSMLFLTRTIELAVWTLALSILKQQAGSLDYKSVQGMGRRFPIPAIALLVAHFSSAGLPILAGFQVKLVLWETLAQALPLNLSLWAILGSVSLFAAGIRALALLVSGEEWTFSTKGMVWPSVLLGIGILGIFLLGIVPQTIFPILTDILRAYTNLAH